VQEACIQGTSTRSVDELVRAMGMSGISKSQVTKRCQEVDARVVAFLERPLEVDWPYIRLDATYVKVRREGRVVSVAVVLAIGVNVEGRREVLGMDIGLSQAETLRTGARDCVSWIEFLRKLRQRGLQGVKLVISRGSQSRRHQGPGRDLAALSRALRPQPDGSRGQAGHRLIAA
jgi:transposase-like protein